MSNVKKISTRFDGKVVMVTGAASGIGLSCVERFLSEGAAAMLTDIDSAALASVTARLSGDGYTVSSVTHDASNEASWRTAMQALMTWRGKLDVLVNNAGIAAPGSVEDETLEGWRKTMAVNLDGVFLGTQQAIALMKQSGGSIINISSIEGIIGEPLIAAYNASKGGVRIFTKSAALHCMNQGYPIRINSVHPGFVDTMMVSSFMTQLTPEVALAFQTDLMTRIPIKRLAQASEIASTVAFLASEDASYMTGSELVVDGGYTAR
jgi:NAD(P)-dependent dehydrogenase (short-subunit alcohol dehydrogenase family)